MRAYDSLLVQIQLQANEQRLREALDRLYCNLATLSLADRSGLRGETDEKAGGNRRNDGRRDHPRIKKKIVGEDPRPDERPDQRAKEDSHDPARHPIPLVGQSV